MIRPGRNPIYKLNKRTTKKINEGYLLNPHGRKYLYYNYSLEDLVKIDPEIIGSGLRWLHTREGWRKIAEIERMSNHNIHDIFKTIDMIESIEDKLVCAIDYHIELSGIPDKMNNGRKTLEDFVYIIQIGLYGPIKIGMSHNPSNRLRDIQMSSPEELNLIAAYKVDRDISFSLEQSIHRALSPFRLKGEWFSVEALDILRLAINKTNLRNSISQFKPKIRA